MTNAFNRRQIVKTGGSMIVLGAAGGVAGLARAQDGATVKLGLLHSLSGTIAIAEASLVDAEKLAIEEINAAGGVLGKKIEAVVEDGASENSVFAEKARKLLERDKVAAIIGCYTSASRKALLPVLNQAKGLLFSGVSPDGLLPEIVERTDHPWFIGVQFHPELKSKPFEPHPLFASFIHAAMEQSRLV